MQHISCYCTVKQWNVIYDFFLYAYNSYYKLDRTVHSNVKNMTYSMYSV